MTNIFFALYVSLVILTRQHNQKAQYDLLLVLISLSIRYRADTLICLVVFKTMYLVIECKRLRKNSKNVLCIRPYHVICFVGDC